jgi:hypothetical protein
MSESSSPTVPSLFFSLEPTPTMNPHLPRPIPCSNCPEVAPLLFPYPSSSFPLLFPSKRSSPA